MDLSTLFNHKTDSQRTMTCSVPGKLFIAGEYAILNPNQSAILAAINQYLTCTIKFTEQERYKITSTQIIDAPLYFTIIDSDIHFESNAINAWSYVIEAIKISFEVLKLLDIPIRYFTIDIQSDLLNESGLKYGLGSSGAVTVGIISSILNFHSIDFINKETLFKLAVIASFRQGSNGSMADIATISHGGWIFYQTFNRSDIQNKIKHNTSLDQLLIEVWEGLKIEPIDVDPEIQLCIGWTGKPASTESLIKLLEQKTINSSHTYTNFQTKMSHLIPALKQALNENNWAMIKYLINENCASLSYLSSYYNVPIETPQLNNLAKIARSLDLPGKLSGAGGGDCGIALSNNPDLTNKLNILWKDNNILPLDFKIASYNEY